MKTEKQQRKFSLTVALLIGVTSFYLGNRFVLIYESSTGDAIKKASNAISELLPSFVESYHMKISFYPFAILFALLTFALAEALYAYYLSQRVNFKVGEEHGGARYGSSEEAAVLQDETEDKNMILSQHIKMSMNTRKTWLNNNIIIIGGAGSGKSRYMVKPNALQFNCNYIIVDSKGVLIQELGNAFLEKDYEIKVLDVKDFQSMRYNFFRYCQSPLDVSKLINNLIENTSDPNRRGNDEFWDKAGTALLTALAYLMMGTDYIENQNFPRIMDLLDLAEASESDENKRSVIDIVFEELQEEVKVRLQSGDRAVVKACKNSYEYLACKQYNLFKKAGGTTAKSILITLGAKLSLFNLPEVDNLLSKDELALETIGKAKIKKGMEHLPDDDPNKYVKTVMFVCISDSDSTFNFLAAVLFQQIFDLLYKQADSNPNGRLPIPVRAILDEFANIGKIPYFDKKIATMRSREISVMILLQNLSQLKSMYKDDVWETIYGNCDTTIFLGGKEFTTLEYLSKNIGNTTIDYMSISETKGANASWSKNNQLIQRALLPPDEIKRLKNNECLIDVRGHYTYRDIKYNLLQHPNYKLTGDADEKQMFKPCEYINKLREANLLESDWLMDMSYHDEELQNKELIDFSQEMLESIYEGAE